MENITIETGGKFVSLNIDGTVNIDSNNKIISFLPTEPVAGLVHGFVSHGTAHQMQNGAFDFVAKPRLRTQSILIKKLAHGRASETKDGAIQLTLKVFCDEGLNISETIAQEAYLGCEAIKEYQLTR